HQIKALSLRIGLHRVKDLLANLLEGLLAVGLLVVAQIFGRALQGFGLVVNAPQPGLAIRVAQRRARVLQLLLHGFDFGVLLLQRLLARSVLLLQISVIALEFVGLADRLLEVDDRNLGGARNRDEDRRGGWIRCCRGGGLSDGAGAQSGREHANERQRTLHGIHKLLGCPGWLGPYSRSLTSLLLSTPGAGTRPSSPARNRKIRTERNSQELGQIIGPGRGVVKRILRRIRAIAERSRGTLRRGSIAGQKVVLTVRRKVLLGSRSTYRPL